MKKVVNKTRNIAGKLTNTKKKKAVIAVFLMLLLFTNLLAMDDKPASNQTQETKQVEGVVASAEDDSKEKEEKPFYKKIFNTSTPTPTPNDDSKNIGGENENGDDGGEGNEGDNDDPNPTSTPTNTPTQTPTLTPTPTPMPTATLTPTITPTPTPTVPTSNIDLVLYNVPPFTPNAAGRFTGVVRKNLNGYWDIVFDFDVEELEPNRLYQLWICGQHGCSSHTDAEFTTNDSGDAQISNVTITHNQWNDPATKIVVHQEMVPGPIPPDPTACYRGMTDPCVKADITKL